MSTLSTRCGTGIEDALIGLWVKQGSRKLGCAILNRDRAILKVGEQGDRYPLFQGDQGGDIDRGFRGGGDLNPAAA